MSQKAPLPSLTGHRLKTRKRDEKKQYDPSGKFIDFYDRFIDPSGKFIDFYEKYAQLSYEMFVQPIRFARLFSNQKSQFWCNFEGLGVENAVIFYDH
jgi:hypothetical protein